MLNVDGRADDSTERIPAGSSGDSLRGKRFLRAGFGACGIRFSGVRASFSLELFHNGIPLRLSDLAVLERLGERPVRIVERMVVR